ncbi:MAG: hypothetical protein H6713_21835 [Myxococcales bacterium]|nr:hypothetical protein [Myxococcales bacterium]
MAPSPIHDETGNNDATDGDAQTGDASPGARALSRLRADPALARGLARVLAEDLMTRPAAAYIEPEQLTRDVLGGLRELAEPARAEALERWIAEQLTRLREHAQTIRSRPLAEHLPPALPAVLERAARRPFTPSAELVRALVDHGATRELMRSILHKSLLDFGRKLWSAVPDTSRIPGARLRSRLFNVAKGVASTVGGELEHQLEDRVRRFVDGTLDRAITMIVERASDPRYATAMAAQRADMVAAVLPLETALLRGELEQVSPADVAADVRAGIASFAAWGELEPTLRDALHDERERLGQTTLRELLAGSSLEETWSAPIEGALARHLQRVFAGEGFARWLASVTDEG